MSSGNQPGWIGRKLATAHPTVFSTYCIVAAFGTYFCMYGFRKPFTAAAYEQQELFGVGLKSVLVISQLLGYMLSKFIGIRVVSEMHGDRRAVAIIGLTYRAQQKRFRLSWDSIGIVALYVVGVLLLRAAS